MNLNSFIEKYKLTNVDNTHSFGKVMKSNSFESLISNIVETLNKSSTLFTVDAYTLDIVNNKDKEIEVIESVGMKDKTYASQLREGKVKTFDINKGKNDNFYNLKLLIRISEKRINNLSEEITNKISTNNDTHYLKFKLNNPDWNFVKEDEGLTPYGSNPELNTYFTIGLWIPKTENGLMKVGNNTFYIYLSQDSRVQKLQGENKVIINRYYNIPNKKSRDYKIYRNKLLFYYLSIMSMSENKKYYKKELDGCIVFASGKKVANIYDIIETFDIEISEEVHNHPVMKYSKERYIAQKEGEYKIAFHGVEEIDKVHIDTGIKALLGIAEPVKKFQRFSGIIDTLEMRLKHLIVMKLSKVCEAKLVDNKYSYDYDVNINIAEAITKVNESIPHDLFMSVIRSGDQDSIATNYNSNVCLYPLKTDKGVIKGSNNIESIFTEEDIMIYDGHGTSQTGNILKINAVSPFLPDELVE